MRAIATGEPVLLRPLGIGEILDAAFRLFRREFKTLAVCVLVVTVPISIVQTLITASTSENAFDLSQTGVFDFSEPTVIEDEFTYIAGQLVSALLSMFAFAFATAACFRAVSTAYLGGHASARESLAFAGRRFISLALTSLLFIVILIPAFLAVIFPGIWLAVAFSLYTPALLFEGKGGFTALKRSYRLVKGRWWATFGTLLLMYLLVTIIQGILSGILVGVIFADSSNEVLVAIVLTLLSIVGFAISLPFQAAVFTLLYFDLRVRTEGFDLQLLADRIDADPMSPDSVAASIGLAEKPPSRFVRPGQAFAPPVPPAMPPPPPPPPPTPPPPPPPPEAE